MINNPFGPTVTDAAITALVISAETRAGGTAVNDRRRAQGWAPLDIFEVDVLAACPEGGEAGQEATPAADDDDDDDDDGHPRPHPVPGFDGKIGSTAIRQRLVHER